MVDVQWSFINVTTATVTLFIIRIFIGKNLGTEGLGVYTLAFTFYLFGMQFAGFGIQGALTKYVAEFLENKDSIRHYVLAGMQSSIVIGTVMGMSLFFLAPYFALSFFNTPELELLIQIVALSYPFLAIQKVVEGTLNGFRRMQSLALLNITRNVSMLVLSIILVLSFDLGALGAVIGFVVPTILVGLVSPILISNEICITASFWDNLALQAVTTFGFYLVISDSVLFLNTNLSNILIGHFLNSSEVGIYAISLLFAQILTLIPEAVRRVTAPIVANLYGKGDILGVREIVFLSMKKAFLLSIITTITIIIFAPIFISILGKEFQLSYLPLLVLLIGYTFNATYLSVGNTLWSIGKLHISYRIFLVTGSLNILLSYILIPQMGLIGAAVATTVSLVVTTTIQIIFVNKYLQITS